MFLNGAEFIGAGPHGERIRDDSFLLLFNAHHEEVPFTLPARRYGNRWTLELSTAEPEAEPGSATIPARGACPPPGRSVLVLRRASIDA